MPRMRENENVPQGFTGQAYNGPAPQPKRSLSIGGSEAVSNNPYLDGSDGTFEVPHTHTVDPTMLTPGISAEFQQSAPPANTEEAAKDVELEGRIGELIQALGTVKSDYEQRIAEMQLQFEATLASQQAPAAVPQMPTNIDPDATVSMGQLIGMFNALGPVLQASGLRSTWDITPEEEGQALQKYPYLNNVQEPAKTLQVKKAVELLRKSKGDSRTQNATGSTPSNGQATPIRHATRNSAPTVPHVETTNQTSAADTRPVGPYQQAQNAYEQAKRIPNKNERLRAMKSAMRQAQAAMGLTDEQFSKLGWSST